MTPSKSTRVDIPTLHLFGDQVRRYSYETDINPSGKLNNDVAYHTVSRLIHESIT